MKRIYLSLIIAGLFCILATQAQEKDSTVNKSITITRAYQPDIQNTNKIISLPKELNPNIQKTNAEYSDITMPMSIEYNIHTLVAKELKHAPRKAIKRFARVGLGNPMNTLFDLICPIITNENNRLDVSINHLGAFKDKRHSYTNGKLQYNHLFDKFDLYAQVEGQHDMFNYYGTSFLGDIATNPHTLENQHITSFRTTNSGHIGLPDLYDASLNFNHLRFNGGVGVRSLPMAENIIFDAMLLHQYFGSYESELLEHQTQLKGKFEVPFDDNKLGMNINIYNFQYNQNIDANYTLLKFNPYYRIAGENWFLKLGAKTGISMGRGQLFTPSPDVDFKWNALPRYLSLFAGVTGDVEVNSFNKIYKENRYFSSQNRFVDTYTPINAYAGLKLSPVNNLIFDVYAQYKIISNPYFYVNKKYDTNAGTNFYHNRFDVITSNSAAKRLSIGTHIAWDYIDQISVYFKGAYHGWNIENQAHAWQLPSWETDFGANIKVGNNVEVNTQFVFEDGRYARLDDHNGVKMSPVFDWNIGTSYTYLDWLSFFVKCNNILNKQYEIYKGYEVQGFNAMIGASISF